MKYVLIRDDDVSCFTEKRFLEKLYGPLLERGIPVNFSVIPQLKTDIEYGKGKPLGVYYKKYRMRGSPAVPPQYRGKKIDLSLEENEEVIQYLLRFPNVEIMQHGFDHGFVGNRNEFDLREGEELKKRIQNGKDILYRAFGRAPRFFIAPRDSISYKGLVCLQEKFKGISIWRLFNWQRVIGNFIRSSTQGKLAECFLPLQTLPLHLKFRKKKKRPCQFIEDFLIVTHPGCLLNRFAEPEEIFSSVKHAIDNTDIFTLVNHHWEYFFDWDDLDKPFFGAWEKVMAHLIDRDDVTFLKFTELYQKLHP